MNTREKAEYILDKDIDGGKIYCPRICREVAQAYLDQQIDKQREIAYAIDNAIENARTGIQEVFVCPDGEILHELMEGEKPFCRIQFYEDCGDSSVGIPSVSFWTLAQNQEGTELADILAKITPTKSQCKHGESIPGFCWACYSEGKEAP